MRICAGTLTVGQRIWPATPCGAGGSGARTPRAALRITTIRDLGDRDYAALALREEYRQKTTVGPELWFLSHH